MYKLQKHMDQTTPLTKKIKAYARWSHYYQCIYLSPNTLSAVIKTEATAIF